MNTPTLLKLFCDTSFLCVSCRYGFYGLEDTSSRLRKVNHAMPNMLLSVLSRPYDLVLISSLFTNDCQFEQFLLPPLQTVPLLKILQNNSIITPSEIFSSYHLQNLVGVKNESGL